MRRNNIIKWLLVSFLAVFSLYGCDLLQDNTPLQDVESKKDISGAWKIIKASRNGTDITELYDFTKFRITFDDNNTYSIDHYVPFLVDNDGKWHLDDPRYPFNLVFKENNSDEELISGLSYPIVDGKRQIILSFSPGCHSNIYTYVFEKTSH